jgi:hypothetical protein
VLCSEPELLERLHQADKKISKVGKTDMGFAVQNAEAIFYWGPKRIK